jgi:hypothetical protein
MALPKKFIPIPRVLRVEQFPQCVHCQGPLDAFAKPGSVIDGIRHAVIETTDENDIRVEKRIQYWKRKRGLICTDCQGDWRSVHVKRRVGESELFETQSIPFVKVDPVLHKPNEKEGYRKDKVLNTRFTQ